MVGTCGGAGAWVAGDEGEGSGDQITGFAQRGQMVLIVFSESVEACPAGVFAVVFVS